MDPLWTPWRMPYIRSIKSGNACIFCTEVLGEEVEPNLVIHRGLHAFIVLNLYPYTVGHLMVVPYRHAASLADLEPEEVEESARLLQLAERAVEEEFHTDRLVVGINIGRCAGAGVEGHIHIHLVPPPDPACAAPSETAPPGNEPLEAIERTRDRLRRAWDRVAGADRPSRG